MTTTDPATTSDAQPATVAEFRRALVPGTRWMVTNHYIDRPDHSSFGTTERVVDRTTGSHFYLKFVGKPSPRHGTAMPKGGQVKRTADGAFLVYGGGAGQAPTDLFLTLRPAPAVPLCSETHNPGVWPYVARCVQTAEPHTWHEDAKGRGWSA